MYDYIIITHLPAFYKINLYNEVCKNKKIFLIFISSGSEERNKDFTNKEINFEYAIINKGAFEKRNIFFSIFKVLKIIFNLKFKKIIVGGWDSLEFWIIIFLNKKLKNCLALESTINETSKDKIKIIVKKLFLSKIDIIFASGKNHIKLAKYLNFKGKIIKTFGVGIINKINYKNQNKIFEKKFLCVARLVSEKNLENLIKIFNDIPSLNLTIIGSGPLEKKLKTIAKKNIQFISHVNNKEIYKYYLAHDVFILISNKEPWGLVIEEAMYFGLPVIVSNVVGCQDIINKKNGIFVDHMDNLKIKNAVLQLEKQDIYRKYKENALKNILFLNEKDTRQINCY